MNYELTQQGVSVVAAFAMGGAAGVLYDLLAQLRKRVKWKASNTAITAAFDALFCVLCGAAFFLLGHGQGQGRLRFFLLIFVVLGSALYHVTLSKLVSKLLSLVLDGIAIVCRFIWRAVTAPFRLISRCLLNFNKNIKQRLHYARKYAKIERGLRPRLR